MSDSTAKALAPEPPPARPLRRTLLRSAAGFALSTFATQGCGLIRTYVAARLLGPGVWGVWLGLRLIIDYGAQLHLGVLFGLHRNVPLFRGRGDHGALRQAKEVAFTFVTIVASLAAVAVVGAGLLWRTSLRGVLIAIAATLATTLVKSYYTVSFRADNRFREVSIAQALGGFVGLSALGLVFVSGLSGFIWGMCAQSVAEGGYLMVCSEVPRLKLHRKVLIELLAIGLLTVLVTSAATLLTSIDRTVILQRLGDEQLGYYGIAFIVITFLIGVAGVPNAILYPRLSERYGQTGRPEDLAPMVVEPIRVLGLGFAVLSGLCALMLPPLVHHFLPKYVPGILAAQIATFGTYSYVIVGVASSALFSLNTQKLYLAILLGASGVSYLAALGFVHMWPGLPAVALGCAVGLLVYLVAVVVGAFRVMHQSLAATWSVITAAVLPLGLVLALSVGADRLFGRFLGLGMWPRALASSALVALTTAPLLLRSATRLLRG